MRVLRTTWGLWLLLCMKRGVLGSLEAERHMVAWSGLDFIKICLWLLCWEGLPAGASGRGGSRKSRAGAMAVIQAEEWGGENWQGSGYIKENQMKLPFFKKKNVFINF